MKIAVTGGAGFIGGNLTRMLIARGHSVAVIDDLSSGNIDNVAEGASFYRQSILDQHSLHQTLADCEAVIHLAARPSVPRSIADPQLTNDVNVNGTLNVLCAAKDLGIQQVVAASSSSVYGRNPTLPKREDLMCMPMSPYAVSKLATESYCEAFRESYGLNAVAYRFFNVFGPLQSAGHAYAAVIPAFIDAALRGLPLQVNGDGNQSRDFTYVDTVCEVLAVTIEDGIRASSPINLALGNRISLNGLIQALGALADEQLRVEYGDPRPGDVRHSQADSTLLRSLFPKLSVPSFEDSLSTTWDWYVKNLDANG